MNDATNINQDSGEYEYYTPLSIIEAARRVLGTIDLDPATSMEGNLRIHASKYYTIKDDGLSQVWEGKVWMNHPFSRAGNLLWTQKLIGAYRSGKVHEAICITYAATSEAWFRPLLEYAQCFLYPRTNYYLIDGTKKQGVTKGSVVTYMGMNSLLFAKEFKDLGTTKIKLIV